MRGERLIKGGMARGRRVAAGAKVSSRHGGDHSPARHGGCLMADLGGLRRHPPGATVRCALRSPAPRAPAFTRSTGWGDLRAPPRIAFPAPWRPCRAHALSEDYGADLLISKDGVTTALQAKRYAKNVGNEAVQEIVAAKGYYNCHTALVVTNSRSTVPARKLASRTGVELWDRDRLVKALLAADTRDGARAGAGRGEALTPAEESNPPHAAAHRSTPVRSPLAHRPSASTARRRPGLHDCHNLPAAGCRSALSDQRAAGFFQESSAGRSLGLTSNELKKLGRFGRWPGSRCRLELAVHLQAEVYGRVTNGTGMQGVAPADGWDGRRTRQWHSIAS
jgi:hypothetical protein